jgi:hypothetical protein
LHRHPNHPFVRLTERNEGNDMSVPPDVIRAVAAIVSTGKEAIVRRERGKWVVLENGRRLVYKEP